MLLLGRQLLLCTNHAAIVKVLRRDLPPTSRVEHWVLQLTKYTLSIQHQCGIDKVMVNVLSKFPFACNSVVEADLSRGES